MQIEQVLKNIEKFPLLDIEKESWYFKEMLCKLYAESFGDYFQYDSFESHLPLDRFKVRKVFDIPFHSDEECYVYVFCLDDKPAALVSKHGDRADVLHNVIDMPTYITMGQVFMTAVMEHKLQEVKDQPSIKALKELDRSYMRWIDEENGLFVIQSPKWQLGFWRMTERHQAFKLTEENDMLPITSIGKFLTDTPSHADDECLVEVEINGNKETMAGREIVFKLIAD